LANDPNCDVRVLFVGSDDYATIRGIDSGKNRFVLGAGLKAKVKDFFPYSEIMTLRPAASLNPIVLNSV
jgi:hypothetical protein